MSAVVLNWDEPAPEALRGGVVTVGNFDGVHRGHVALVSTARDLAARTPVVAVTFDPHPLKLLDPARYQPPLTTIEDRARRLGLAGVDHVVALRTTEGLLALSPLDFFRRVLVDSLAASGVVEGFNFRFGRDRQGDNARLAAWCADAGIDFREVPPFLLGDLPVSSSRVRGAIADGDIDTAHRLLAHRYRIAGTVGTGDRRGRTLGFPTANLVDVATLLPAVGVYAVAVHVGDQMIAGAMNVGPNPTFGIAQRKVEVHLIDFDGDLYGSMLSVDLVARIRDTVKFADFHALKRQMADDVVAARGLFEETMR